MVKILLKESLASLQPNGDEISADEWGNLHVFAGKKRVAIVACDHWIAAEVAVVTKPALVKPLPEGSNE